MKLPTDKCERDVVEQARLDLIAWWKRHPDPRYSRYNEYAEDFSVVEHLETEGGYVWAALAAYRAGQPVPKERYIPDHEE